MPFDAAPGRASRSQTDVTESLRSLVVQRFEYSQREHSAVHALLPQRYNLFRGVAAGEWDDYKNNVWVPLTWASIWTDVARKVTTILNSQPILSFTGYGPDDQLLARKQEALIQAQLTDADIYRIGIEMVLNGNLYGVGILRLGWRFDQQLRTLTFPDELTGLQQMKRQMVTAFDGPDLSVVDNLDFFPQPGKKRIADMEWGIERVPALDFDEIAERGRVGQYDAAAVEQLRREGGTLPTQSGDSRAQRWPEGLIGLSGGDMRSREPLAKPVELLEYVGYIPSDVLDAPRERYLITVANRRIVLRARPLPFWHGEMPWHDYHPNPDSHYFYSAGMAEVMEKLQATINRFYNQRLDAMDYAIDPATYVDANLIQERNMSMYPGRMIRVNGDPNKAVKEFAPDLRGVALGGQMHSEMWEAMQIGSGIFQGPVMGAEGGGSDRKTAYETAALREAAGTRLALGAGVFEKFMERIGKQAVLLNRQFLTQQREVLMLGEGAILDPVTQRPIPVARASVSYADMLADYDQTCHGASSALTKGQRQGNFTQVATLLFTQPWFPLLANIPVVVRDMLDLFEMRGSGDWILPQGGPGAGAPVGVGPPGGAPSAQPAPAMQEAA